MVTELAPLDARIPNWDLSDLFERPCPICNSIVDDRCFRRPDKLFISCCKKCKTYFVSPAPSEQQLSSFYTTYDVNHRRAQPISTIDLLLSYQEIDPLADFRIKVLKTKMSFSGAKVLDVGFGRAQLLYCLKKLGAIPHGVELDPKAI